MTGVLAKGHSKKHVSECLDAISLKQLAAKMPDVSYTSGCIQNHSRRTSISEQVKIQGHPIKNVVKITGSKVASKGE